MHAYVLTPTSVPEAGASLLATFMGFGAIVLLRPRGMLEPKETPYPIRVP